MQLLQSDCLIMGMTNERYTMATKAKETPVVVETKAALGLIDFRKSNNTVITVGKIKIIGVLYGAEKKNGFMVVAVPNEAGKKGKCLGFFGVRKDGKGVYGSSEITEICSPVVAQKAQEMVVA